MNKKPMSHDEISFNIMYLMKQKDLLLRNIELGFPRTAANLASHITPEHRAQETIKKIDKQIQKLNDELMRRRAT